MRYQKMAENLFIPQNSTREGIYQAIIPQIEALIEGETDLIANLANVTAVLREAFGFLWIGFYIVRGEELVLAPFQGTLACTRIRKGRGVCGVAWATAETQIVPDVELFPGHIACSSASRSEIVVPIVVNGEVVGVLDVDSDKPDDFSPLDAKYLQQIVQTIAKTWK